MHAVRAGHATAEMGSTAAAGATRDAVAMRTRYRNGTRPTRQHAMLLETGGVGRVVGHGDVSSSTFARTGAEAPQEQEMSGRTAMAPSSDGSPAQDGAEAT